MPTTQTNPFDHGSRALTRRAGPSLLSWLAKLAPPAMRFMRWLDTRLTVPGHPERVCDTIAHVLRPYQGGFPWALPVEFQAAPDELMFGRALVYAGLIWLQEKPTDLPGDRFNLLCVVVNLTGVGNRSRAMNWLPDAGVWLGVIEWNLELLDARVILEQIAGGEAPRALLAWITLMKNGNDPDTIRRWLEVADTETDAARKADFALVVIFAQLTGHERTWQKALEGFNVMESVIVNEWKAEAVAKAVLGVLEARLGAVPEELRAKIAGTASLDVVQRWVTLAATADNLDKFRQDAGV